MNDICMYRKLIVSLTEVLVGDLSSLPSDDIFAVIHQYLGHSQTWLSSSLPLTVVFYDL